MGACEEARLEHVQQRKNAAPSGRKLNVRMRRKQPPGCPSDFDDAFDPREREGPSRVGTSVGSETRTGSDAHTAETPEWSNLCNPSTANEPPELQSTGHAVEAMYTPGSDQIITQEPEDVEVRSRRFPCCCRSSPISNPFQPLDEEPRPP
jgi:hypothetical protein